MSATGWLGNKRTAFTHPIDFGFFEEIRAMDCDGIGQRLPTVGKFSGLLMPTVVQRLPTVAYRLPPSGSSWLLLWHGESQ